MIDALAWSGLAAVRRGFFDAWNGGDSATAEAGRAAMAYAALLSGIALAQAGLGSVHGLASPLGAFYPIPHGVCCGTLLAAATEVNVRALRERNAGDHPALAKYAAAGRLFSGRDDLDDDAARQALIETLAAWVERIGIARLGAYGVRGEDLPKIVAHSRGNSMKTNPVTLTDEEIGAVLRARM
jgi:alcohol dehydrogenase